jgi:RNA polymerase sigma factor (sigma-70 family)
MTTSASVPVVEEDVVLPAGPDPSVRRRLGARVLAEQDRAFDPRHSSWEQLVTDHRGFVLRRAMWLTRNPHDAEDLTHDVFIRVFGALDSYVPGGSFHGWLHRITTNVYLDQVRRRNRIRFDALSEAHERRLVSSEPDPAHAVHDAMLAPHLQQALDALPPMFREVVVLRDVCGLSYDQVARTLGVRQATVRTRSHRGRARLRAALTPAPHGSLSVGAGQVSTG